MEYITLENGLKMPMLGLGTWRSKTDDAYNAALHALENGYRYIDTAAIYGNEEEIGRAIKDSGVAREELFITTKLWNSEQGYESTYAAFEESLKKLGLDYVDQYLIHWPQTRESEVASWKAMEEIYESGKAKSIGVSNFNFHHLQNLLDNCKIKPMMNQVECHIGVQNVKLQAFCQEHGIHLTAYAPMMSDKIGEMLENEVMIRVAKAHGKTVPHVALRYLIQRGIVVIPKSIKPARIDSNKNVFDFELTDSEMGEIRTLNNGNKIFPDPDNIDF
jgi:diketogulonate reductase-like aldo/keto reductase